MFHPQQGRKYIMYTDASEYAIGAVLHQEDGRGGLHVVAYANRTLKGAELHYCTSEKEILAIINALRKFRHYLYGAHFEIHTDNQALSFILKCRLANSRLTRWVLAIQEYSFTIKYCKGSENTTADALSRYPPVEREEVYEAADDELKILDIQYTVAPGVTDMLRNIGREQDNDPRLLAKKQMIAAQKCPHYQIQANIMYNYYRANGRWYYLHLC